MNWIFDTYSNVYQAAMMQSHDARLNGAPAKEPVRAKSMPLFALFNRR